MSHDLDWPRIIGVIDKFVAMADSMTAEGKKKWPTNFNHVLNNRFKPFCTFIASLIKKAKANAAWVADQADLVTLNQLYTNMTNDCLKWKVNKGGKNGQWIELETLVQQYPWAPANYLANGPTPVPRNIQMGGAVMKLRPQARVKYS